MSKRIAFALISLGLALPAFALGPCDCTAAGWLGNCIASLELKQDTWVKVLTNVPGTCSRVDWYADNDPQMTVVLNGAEIENLAPKRPMSLVVQSCKVCKDLRADRLVPGGEPLGPLEPRTPTPALAPTTLVTVIEGQWQGQYSDKLGTHAIRLMISRSGETLVGTMTVTDGDHEMHAIQVSGNQVNFSQSFVFSDFKWTGTYNADSNSIVGSAGNAFGQATFEVKKK